MTPARHRWAAPVLVLALLEVAGGGSLLASMRAPSGRPDPAASRLLTASDVGPGWTGETSALQAEPVGCFRPRAALLATTPAEVSAVTWTAPTGLPAIDDVAAAYPSPAAASAAFRSVAASLRGCTSFSADVSGEPVTASVAPISLPDVGQRCAAASVIVHVAGQTGGADFVVAQHGARVMLLVYGDAGVPDAVAVAGAGAAAESRLTS